MKFTFTQYERAALLEIGRHPTGVSRVMLEDALGASQSQIYLSTEQLKKKGVIAIIRKQKPKGAGAETSFYGLTEKGRLHIKKMWQELLIIVESARTP